MRITEQKAKSLGMWKDRYGNWKASLGTLTNLIESEGKSGSNAGMSTAKRRTPAQNRADIISSAVATGLSLEEATHFYEQGHRG
jgi:hypothetical protein